MILDSPQIRQIQIFEIQICQIHTHLERLNSYIPHFFLSPRSLVDVFKTCLQDVLKTCLQDISSGRPEDMSSRRLEDIFSVTIFLFPRRLQDVFKTFLQDVFKTSWKAKNCYAEDVLKTPSRRLQDQQMFAGLLNKNINFDKNEAESKMENLTHSFRETNLVLQLV